MNEHVPSREELKIENAVLKVLLRDQAEVVSQQDIRIRKLEAQVESFKRIAEGGEMRDIIQQIELKFTSGNSVPVERSVLLVEEWKHIKQSIAELEQERDAARESRFRLVWLVRALANGYVLRRFQKKQTSQSSQAETIGEAAG